MQTIEDVIQREVQQEHDDMLDPSLDKTSRANVRWAKLDAGSKTTTKSKKF